MTSRLKHFFSLRPLELPGRGVRSGEKLIHDRRQAVNDLLDQIVRQRNGRPFFIYGHSMGAELGLLIVKEMEEMKDPPDYLIVSGNPGPNVRDFEELYKLPNPFFFEKLMELGGLSKELLQNNELIEIFEPILRADFEILEKDQEPFVGRIKTPVYAIMGSGEKHVDKILNWEAYTACKLNYKILEGGHFFINEHTAAICEILISCKNGS